MFTYLFKAPIVVVLCDASGERPRELPVGSVFMTTSSTPDCSGMIDGMCDGTSAIMFARDLDERAERIVDEPASDEVPA